MEGAPISTLNNVWIIKLGIQCNREKGFGGAWLELFEKYMQSEARRQGEKRGNKER